MRAALALALFLAPATALAQPPPAARTMDRVAVQFYTPETGGAARPRFITERTLAFEARLEAMAEQNGPTRGYQERHVRSALEHHVAEEMLAKLPLERSPSGNELASLFQDVGDALLLRFGGREAVLSAANAEGIETVEVDGIVRRQVLAAIYIDRSLTPILHPTEEQLREVYRSSSHPYRGDKFTDIKDKLSRWFVAERIRVTESAFLQTARSRVNITVVPKK